jgi:Fungal fucose-specific lectin
LLHLTSDLIQIRVYYLNSSNVLSELCWDAEIPDNSGSQGESNSSGKLGAGNNWYAGKLSTFNFQVAPYSNLAAFVLDDSRNQLQINLYAQQTDNSIMEYMYNYNSGSHILRACAFVEADTSFTDSGTWVTNWHFSNIIGLAGTRIGADIYRDNQNNRHIK